MERPQLRKIPQILLESLLAISLSMAANAETRSGFPLMMEITDPRSLALGGANVADLEHIASVQVNPASSASGDAGVQATYARHPADFWIGRIMAANEIGGYTTGLFLGNYGYGTLNESVSGVGFTGGSFDASEQLLGGFIAGTVLPGLNWGVTGKIGWWKIADASAKAGALDLGLTYNTGWEDLTLGATARNLGSQWTASSGIKSPLSREFTVGGSRRLRHLPLTLNAAVHFRRSGEGDYEANFLPGNPGMAFGVGGEFEIQPNGARKPLNLRIGYRSLGKGLRVGQGGDALAGFAFGMGLIVRRVSFDYTYAPLGALGDIHRLGVSGTL